MIVLPTKKTEAKNINPRFTILFGKPKCGKTTIAAGLDNHLIVDMDVSEGTDSVTCTAIKARSLNRLEEIRQAIVAANAKKGGFVYEYGIFDTATDLEDLVLPMALKMYTNTPMGKTFKGTDVRDLPKGLGYFYIREAYKLVIKKFLPLFPHFILLGHTKDKMIEKNGKELTENTIDLTGKLERIIPAQADALGYVYREKNKTIINFKGGGDSIVEARPQHLRGKEIVIAESDEDNVITTYWDRIFIK
jgi:hypothetical protein